MFMQVWPAMKPIGLVAVTTLPVSSAPWEICACWPFRSVSVSGWPAAPAGTPLPPTTAALGTIVATVPSSRAMMLSDGLPAACAETLTAMYSLSQALEGTSNEAAVTATEPPPNGLIWYATTGTSVVMWNALDKPVPTRFAVGIAVGVGHSGAAPLPPPRNSTATSPGGTPVVAS
jgi:hypothetical protein